MEYVSEGMKVLVEHGGRYVSAMVVVAAGTCARIQNEVLGLNSWYYVSDIKPWEPANAISSG